MHNSIQILFTGQQLDQEIVQTNSQNFVIDVLPFIETVLSTQTQATDAVKALAKQNVLVVLTSQIAVDWVTENIAIVPNWSIACMKGQTQKALSDKGWGALVHYTASNSLELAKQIAAHVPKSTTIHFVGSNQRLASLPTYLHQKGFIVNEMIAYTTIAKQQSINKQYNCMVFLSPSAVNSFFDQHTINNEVILFAIGQTTADAIKIRSHNEVVISEGVSQIELFKTIYKYYQTICH